ncbi:helix-turn-helix domain-containing protein [Lysobacter sp. MMG2]|uniref:helix-turn-helix domain-containing protein n=1 Tax=Lysobacter sp. MMG2 TaxID=2801338 RepID=UPI001C225C4E|nr:helix-turn-helix transcriptional regulator [Lysobacter sp. MMG2]MBU8977352.1 helix-turn-helix domain-containing protein [Lysobacter sp. MMG2]
MDEATLRLRLGSVIRAHREALDVSQDRFADVIEMHRAYYGSIERGSRNLTIATLSRVAAGLRVRPSQLLQEAGA